jgi:hypothetical protein
MDAGGLGKTPLRQKVFTTTDDDVRPSRRLLKDLPLARHPILNRIWDVLQTRTTSKLEDEPICLGMLLGVDMERLPSVQALARMTRLFLEIRYIPVEVVFGIFHRMSEPGFRWAPQNFIGNKHLSLEDRDESIPFHMGTITTEGLNIAMGGCILPDVSDAMLNEQWEPLFDAGVDVCETCGPSPTVIGFLMPSPGAYFEQAKAALATREVQCALVMQRTPLRHCTHEYSTRQQRMPAALVKLGGKEGGTLCVKYVAPVRGYITNVAYLLGGSTTPNGHSWPSLHGLRSPLTLYTPNRSISSALRMSCLLPPLHLIGPNSRPGAYVTTPTSC